MESGRFVIPSFKGYSAIQNRTSQQGANIRNFVVGETSLETRKGCAQQIAALSTAPLSLHLLSTFAGNKYYICAEASNLWLANSTFAQWSTNLKSNCSGIWFAAAGFNDKLYLGNGYEQLVYDGTTLANMTGTPPEFTAICAYNSRLWTNNTAEMSYINFGGVDSGEVKTSNYMRIPEGAGDRVMNFAPCIQHLFILNEYTAYAMYGTGESKSFIGSHGTASARSMATVGGHIYWLSQDGVYKYTGAVISPISFEWGEVTELLDANYLYQAVATGYRSQYWLAATGVGQTSNNLVLMYDSLATAWTIFEYPFSVNGFLVDGDDLYCIASDKKTYKMETGTDDAGTVITALWQADNFDFGAEGCRKRLKAVAVELANTSATSTLGVQFKCDDLGVWGTSYPIIVPSISPGATRPKKVRTLKGYNWDILLTATGPVKINKMAIDFKTKTKIA